MPTGKHYIFITYEKKTEIALKRAQMHFFYSERIRFSKNVNLIVTLVQNTDVPEKANLNFSAILHLINMVLRDLNFIYSKRSEFHLPFE